MLQNNLELIVQYPERKSYICRGFRGLWIKAPCYVVFEGATNSDQGVANLFGNEFCQELLRLAGAQEEQRMPCGGCQPSVMCHAMDEPTCRKILVRIAATGHAPSGGTWSVPNAEQAWLKHRSEPEWQVIPTMPAGTNVATHVPTPWRGVNVCFWSRHPVEMIWSVMQRAGLAPEESRLFISYVRRDSMAVADQLFTALTETGFDVFLDRCSVPVGVPFQDRLMQDLCDKAMVVLLNSAGVADSHWVQEEIAMLKTYRLGLLELQFPGAIPRQDIDPDFTEVVSAKNLISAGSAYVASSKKLNRTKLRRVVERIRQIHARALHRRRYELLDSVAAALSDAGKAAQPRPDGTFLLSGARGRNVVVGLTARPPELDDFCSLHQRGSISSKQVGWLISPAPFFVAQRQASVSWLGGVSNIQHADEGQIIQLVAKL